MTIYTSPFPDVAFVDQSITERVFSNLYERPDEIVLIDGTDGREFSARDVVDQVKRLAGGLTAAGFGAGKTVALMAPNCPEYCIIFHAVAWAGGTITTLNPSYTAAEVAHQTSDASADLLIVIPDFMETAIAGAGDTPVIAIGTPEFADLFGDPLESQVAVDLDAHTVALPYSSGTTGLPKGVMLSHRNMVVNLDQTIPAGDFRAGEITAAFLPFFHIYGMTVIMNLHLGAGGAIVTMPRFDLPEFLRISQDYKARRMWVVPPVAIALAKHPLIDNYDLSHLELVFIAAAPSGAELTDAVSARLGCTTLQGYGMTELSPVSHVVPVSAPKSGAVGLLISNTSCKIVDPDNLETVPEGQEGEVWIKGPQIMQGYLNNPKATAETITEDGWLRTGDIAMIDSEG